MEEDFDLTKERECFSCFYDLHMSVACCKCSSDQFACLKHATLLCSCGKDDRFVLVRYTMDELNTLIEALEEKLVPLKAWASADLGLVGMNCEDSISGISHSKKNNGPVCSPKIEENFEKDSANLCMSEIMINKHKKDIVGKTTDSMLTGRCFNEINPDYIFNAHESMLQKISDVYHNSTTVVEEAFHEEDSEKKTDSMQFGSASASHVSLDNVNSSSSIDVSDCCAFSGKTSFRIEMSGPSPNLGVPLSSSSTTEVVEELDKE